MEMIVVRLVAKAIILFALIMASGFVGSAIRPRFGFLAGFFLGPFGWLLAAVLRAVDLLEEIRNVSWGIRADNIKRNELLKQISRQ